MSKEIFLNRDLSAIKQLLKEIGKERYLAALNDVGLSQMKPLTMEGFYLEWVDGDVNLWYRFPIGNSYKIMEVLGYWAVPKTGWERVRK